MLYSIAHVLVSILARLCFRLSVVGVEHVPQRGGAIIAANHASYLDIPLLGCALKRRADFIGKAELFKNPLIGFLFRRLGGFPIKRGGIDRAAIAEAVRRLRAGRLVVFYPEGTRSTDGKLQELKPGIGLVAAKAGVPIIPVLIEGTGRALPREGKRIRIHPVQIKFGPPLDPFKSVGPEKGRVFYSRISHAVMERIQELKTGEVHA